MIVLVGAPPAAAEEAQTALEHGATVLSVELARLQSVAETELRLGRDLVEELLSNTDERAALSRAQGLDNNLGRNHRVAVVVEDPARRRDPDSRFRAVRRAALDAELDRLLVPRGEAVVIGAYDEPVWDAFESRLVDEIGRNVWVGVGGVCQDLTDFPRSHHEARVALRTSLRDPGLHLAPPLSEATRRAAGHFREVFRATASTSMPTADADGNATSFSTFVSHRSTHPAAR